MRGFECASRMDQGNPQQMSPKDCYRDWRVGALDPRLTCCSDIIFPPGPLYSFGPRFQLAVVNLAGWDLLTRSIGATHHWPKKIQAAANVVFFCPM